MSSGVSPEIIERYSAAFTQLAEPLCRIARAIAGLKCRALSRSELQISFYALGVLPALDRLRRIEQGRGSDRSVFVRDGDLTGPTSRYSCYAPRVHDETEHVRRT
jgi:hypothetical protein